MSVPTIFMNQRKMFASEQGGKKLKGKSTFSYDVIEIHERAPSADENRNLHFITLHSVNLFLFSVLSATFVCSLVSFYLFNFYLFIECSSINITVSLSYSLFKAFHPLLYLTLFFSYSLFVSLYFLPFSSVFYLAKRIILLFYCCVTETRNSVLKKLNK